MSRLTIKDIARICNVGTSTVSRAINDDPTVNWKTKQMILDAVQKYHYVPNNSARNLKRSESNNVAVLVKGQNNNFFQSMYGVFEDELQKYGYTFTMREAGTYDDEMNIAQELIREKRLKGIIFLGGMMENPDYELRHIDIPYVLCTVALKENYPDCSFTSIDDEKESEKAVSYLCEMGHRKIAMISSLKSDIGVGNLRQKGYKKALAKYGIPYDENLVGHMKENIPDYSYENGYEVTKELLSSGNDFTALFAISDTTAFGAYRAILESGKRIPEDISIIGFDGIDMTKFMYPSLTTIKQPGAELATESVQMLHAEINDKPHTYKVFDAALVEQESVRHI